MFVEEATHEPCHAAELVVSGVESALVWSGGHTVVNPHVNSTSTSAFVFDPR